MRQDCRGLFISMFFNSNTILWDSPSTRPFRGCQHSLCFDLLHVQYDLFWTLGTYLIQRDGEGEAQFDLKTSLKKVFSPPLMGFLLG